MVDALNVTRTIYSAQMVSASTRMSFAKRWTSMAPVSSVWTPISTPTKNKSVSRRLQDATMMIRITVSGATLLSHMSPEDASSRDVSGLTIKGATNANTPLV